MLLYYFTQSHIPRALPVDELAAQANTIGLNGHAFEDVNIALDAAIKNANHTRFDSCDWQCIFSC